MRGGERRGKGRSQLRGQWLIQWGHAINAAQGRQKGRAKVM